MEYANQNDININYSIDENTYNTNFGNTTSTQTNNQQLNIPLPPKLNILSSRTQFETDNEQNIIENQNKIQITADEPDKRETAVPLKKSFIDNGSYSATLKKKSHKKKSFKNKFKRDITSMNFLCSNCGKRGHTFNSCTDPLTSCGIICFKKVHTKNKIDLFNYKILLVRRKHTIGYIELLRGKYNINNNSYINKLFNIMTNEEIDLINETDNFDALRNKLGMTRDYRGNYREYDYAKKKFYTVKDNIDYYLANKKDEWNETEWGLPKGKRNSRETNLECAIREFEEETGIPSNKITILKNVKPLEEIYSGINNIKYKHIYYFSILNESEEFNDNEVNLNKNNKEQSMEISKIKWFSFNEIENTIRYYYISKLNIIHKSFQLINNMKQFFEL